MVYLVNANEQTFGTRFIFYLILIIVVVIVVILLWIYVIQPYVTGKLFTPSNVACNAAPATPTGLAVVADNNTAKVSWNPTADTDNYILYVGTVHGFTTATAVRTITVIGNSVAVLNLLPITYYFFVVAVNSCGTSNNSPQISLTITVFPQHFKLCKQDNQLICLLMQSNGAEARVSQACPTNECTLTYLDSQFLANSDQSLCLFENNPGGNVVENLILTKTCTSPTNWNFDSTTGRVTTNDGMCLGADDFAESTAYNTTCSNIGSITDTRYTWVVQPI